MAPGGGTIVRAAGFDPGTLMEEDGTVIASASGGLALCGTYVGSCAEKRNKRSSKQLLRNPKECKLKGPDQAFKMDAVCFSSIHSSKDFCEQVEKSGWSLAFNASISTSLEFGGQFDRNKVHKQGESHMSTEACHMQCWYFPKASFSIPQHHMRLTEEALEDVRRVRTLGDAELFLGKYNSHVSSGRYHLGGLLLKGVTIKTEKATSMDSMLETVTNNLHGEFDFKCISFKASGKVVHMNERSSSSTEDKSSQQAMMGAFVTALGPHTADDEAFKVGLEDKSTWHIIDSTSEGTDLVPVWEIIQIEDVKLDLQRSCDLIRETWQRSVSSDAHKDARLSQLLHSSYSNTFAGRSNPFTKDEAVGKLMSRLVGIPGFKDSRESPSSPVVLEDILLKVWTAANWMADFDDSNWDTRQLLFEIPEFDHLLLQIAQSAESDMEAGKKLLRYIINRDVQRLLLKAGVSLKEPVKALLQSPIEAGEVMTRLIPLEIISPSQLLERLKDLVADDESHIGHLGMPSRVFCDIVLAIKACLHQSMHQAVKEIVIKHGFNGNGDYCDMEGAAKEQVLAIIQELDTSLKDHAVPNATSQTEDVTAHQIFPIVAQYTMPHEGIFTFAGNVLVDRPLELSEDSHRNMMDRIRHRMEPFAPALRKAGTIDTDDFRSFFEDADDSASSSNTQDVSTADSSAVEVLIQLLMRSDLLAQIALFQLLLEQRYSVPLIVPKESFCLRPRTERIKCFGHHAEALSFVQVKLENQEILSMVEDTKLPRVVFVSNRKVADACETPDMASEVLSCQFLSKFSKTDIEGGFTVVELGVGFIKTPNDALRKHRPCLAFCVWGDHNQVEAFLIRVADVIIIESEPFEEASCSLLRPIQYSVDIDVLYWSINSSRKGRKNIGKSVVQIWGSFNVVATGISMFLARPMNMWSSKGPNNHSTSFADCLSETVPPFNKLVPENSEVGALRFEVARVSFKLQKSFNEEANFYFQSLSQRGVDFSRKMKELQDKRAFDASEVQELPILRFFVRLLSEEHHVKRRIGIMQFQLSIDKELQPILEQASKAEDDRFKKHQQYPEDLGLREEYYLAKRQHLEQMLGLEHLWRELSHIFIADPNKVELPKLAAHHLLDGFPLEVVDGDSTMFQPLWMESILGNLDRMLHKSLGHKPKIFVLSVVGLQSSGKSTLLNLMFGTQLKTSTGQCTRGVYLQLVKSEWPEFDYVLLLDTEGIRSPEHHGREDAEIQDNRLATFAVLPADACLIVVANEEDNGLKDVLPMVLLAFKGSAMAEKCAGRMQAKLFFVYRSIDTNDVKKLRQNQRKLQEELRDASSEISRIRICGSRPSSEAPIPSSLSINPLNNFNIDEQEEKSDVKYLGNLKKGHVPPHDVPDFDYGEKVVDLRKYIHKRISQGQWRAHELQEWIEYLGMVWQCIADANFELGFLNRLEYSRYLDLQGILVGFRDAVGRNCLEVFESLDRDLQASPKNSDYADLRSTFTQRVDDICSKEGKAVKEILERKEWQRWKLKESTRWDVFCLDQSRQSEGRLQDCIDGVLKFDNVVKDYCKMMQKDIESKAVTYHTSEYTSDDRQEKMESNFSDLFQSVLRGAAAEYPPLAIKVPDMVHNIYERNVVGTRYGLVRNTNDHILDSPFVFIHFDSVKQLFGHFMNRIIGHDGAISKQQLVIEELIPKVDRCLKHAKQYSDHLVEEVIRLSEESISGKLEKKKAAQTVHDIVKKVLIQKLRHIQCEWDETHNVATRLEKERSRLQEFFINCANQVGATRTFTLELSKLIQFALKDSFKNFIASKVRDNVQAEAWLCNWKVMRAHLDLHLVELIEEKKTNDLILCVQDGSSHYNEVLRVLLEKAIWIELETDLRKSFVESIKRAMQLAALSAMDSKSLPIFLKTLHSELSTNLKVSQLAESLMLVNEEVYSKHGNHIDFLAVEREVSPIIVVETDIMSIRQVASIVSLVKNMMIASQSESARPRCEERCPHCHLTCFLAAGHDNCHDTLHQPSGLVGGRIEITDEIDWRSCSKNVLDKISFKPKDGSWTLFENFNLCYPTWSIPGEGFGTVKVREYIFAHYQEELVRSWGNEDFKQCTKIPQEFYHDIKALRRELENVLQRFERR